MRKLYLNIENGITNELLLDILVKLFIKLGLEKEDVLFNNIENKNDIYKLKDKVVHNQIYYDMFKSFLKKLNIETISISNIKVSNSCLMNENILNLLTNLNIQIVQSDVCNVNYEALKIIKELYNNDTNLKADLFIISEVMNFDNVIKGSAILQNDMYNKNYNIVNEYIVECNIDDLNPEYYGHIIDSLMNIGAKDAFLTSIIMKKGRPAIKLSVLCDKTKLEEVKKYIFLNTTSLGIRQYEVEKSMLNRNFRKVQTKYGEFTIKEALYDNIVIKTKAEYEEIKEASKRLNVSLIEINSEIQKNV